MLSPRSRAIARDVCGTQFLVRKTKGLVSISLLVSSSRIGRRPRGFCSATTFVTRKSREDLECGNPDPIVCRRHASALARARARDLAVTTGELRHNYTDSV